MIGFSIRRLFSNLSALSRYQDSAFMGLYREYEEQVGRTQEGLREQVQAQIGSGAF